ncbi:MAG: hypothetical protein HY811_00835 [Planctomycetes bacterium]|nr:hypothetical protein [Planctomycetota bacterium]
MGKKWIIGNSPLSRGVRGVLFLCVLCAFVVPSLASLAPMGGNLYADSWSQTTFPAGTGVFTSTQPANGNADATLSNAFNVDSGTGADGAFDSSTYNGSSIAGISGTAPNITINTSNATKLGTYNFTTFTIAAGHTVTANGTNFLIIKATGNVTISGTLNGSGSNGQDGSTTGQAAGGGGGGAVKILSAGNITINAGGFILANGGNGGNVDNNYPNTPGGPGGPGGGTGGAGCGYGGVSGGRPGTGSGPGGGGWTAGGGGGGYGGAGGVGGGSAGVTYGAADLATLYGGSGGGGGCTGNGGGGGGSGGSIFLTSGNVTISGFVRANGGNGVASTNGGGGGGRIRVESPTITGLANCTANGGTGVPNNGAAGTISSSTGGGGYAASGTYLSPLINPSGLVSWGALTYTKNTPANTTLTIDVLKADDNSVLSSNVTSGTNLSSLIPAYTFIKLRANFSSTNPSNTSTLSDWGINYTGGGTTVTTSNWTDLTQGKAVQMGQSTAYVKFTMKTESGTTRWKRFRIDKGLKTYTNIAAPDSKIEIQVWCETSGNGFWDSGDTLISKGNFVNGTCWLNMKRWEITTTPKTYYIVYKLKDDIGGGQRAGVKITNSSYLEFENATCVGVP